MKPSHRLPVTLCMLTLDEEDRVAGSLAAVADRVERTIVLDAGSRDRTRELAERAGAEVIVRPWKGFVDARRHLLSLVRTGWVLMIDADEVIDEGLFDELGERGFPDCPVSGFQMRRRTVYQGKRLRRVFQPDWKTVLVRAADAYFEDRSVHESLKVRGTVERLRTEISHYTYRSAADHYARIRKYAELAARDLAARGKRAGPANLWLRPAWRWFTEVFLLGAIVDGKLGLIMASRSAYGVHLRYRYLRDLDPS